MFSCENGDLTCGKRGRKGTARGPTTYLSPTACPLDTPHGNRSIRHYTTRRAALSPSLQCKERGHGRNGDGPPASATHDPLTGGEDSGYARSAHARPDSRRHPHHV